MTCLQSALVAGRQTFCFAEILGRVGIEERIERRIEPVDGGEFVARGEAMDGAAVVHHQSAAEVAAQRHVPQPDGVMGLAPGRGDRELRVLRDPCPMQPCHQVAREERAVAGGAEHPGDAGPVRRHPVEPGQDAGQRPGEPRDAIGRDRQGERREPRGIAIGIDDQAIALRLEPFDHPIEDGAAADGAHRLVAAAHAPRQAACEDDTGCRWMIRHDD